MKHRVCVSLEVDSNNFLLNIITIPDGAPVGIVISACENMSARAQRAFAGFALNVSSLGLGITAARIQEKINICEIYIPDIGPCIFYYSLIRFDDMPFNIDALYFFKNELESGRFDLCALNREFNF